MKVLTWNIQWGLGMDGRVDLARIARHAREFGDPDVICLQEVADGMNDLPGQDLAGQDLAGQEGADQFAEIARLFPDHQAVVGAGVEIFDEAGKRRRFGNMILSRLPVLQVLRHQLPWPGAEGLNMPRVVIEASIASPFGPVRVMTTHAEYFSADLRAAGIEAIRAVHSQASSRETTRREAGTGPYRLRPGSRSAILTGDFNMRPADATRHRLLEPFGDGTMPFVDAWTARHGDTPHPPSFCIADGRYGTPHCCDYIFVTADLASRVTGIVYDTRTRLSDHQPVLTTFEAA